MPRKPRNTPSGTHCPGTARSTGQPCKNTAGKGTDHPGIGPCKSHGGNSPGAKIQATRIQLQREARAFGLPVEDGEASDLLLEEIRATAGSVRWLWEQVRALEVDGIIWGPVRSTTAALKDDPGIDPDAGPVMAERTEHGARKHILVQVWQEERTHLRKLCEGAIRAGIEERRVRVAEKDGTRFVAAIRGILADLGLTPEQEALIPTVVPKWLRDMQPDAQAG